MSIGSIITSAVGSGVGYVAPATGPATAAELTTISAGQVSGTGQATNILIDAAGTDTAQSTILHGVAQSVTALGPSVSPLAAPLLEPALNGPSSEVAAATQPTVTLLAPHTGPAASALVVDIGQGNVTAAGHATGMSVTAAGTDINQSTILHGVANTVTAITEDGSFHFSTVAGSGMDSLSGILGHASDSVHTASSPGAPSAFHTAAVHVDLPFEHPLDTLLHATHHA